MYVFLVLISIKLLYTTAVIRIGTVYPRGLYKGLNLRFCVDSWVQQETHEESRRIYWLKRCKDANEDQDNCPNILTDKNYETSSQKFRQTVSSVSDNNEVSFKIGLVWFRLGFMAYQPM